LRRPRSLCVAALGIIASVVVAADNIIRRQSLETFRRQTNTRVDSRVGCIIGGFISISGVWVGPVWRERATWSSQAVGSDQRKEPFLSREPFFGPMMMRKGIKIRKIREFGCRGDD
jgi:hypothetical protein